MNRPGRELRRAAAAGFASAVAAATLAGPALAGTQAAGQGPVVKLIAAQNSITLPSVRGRVYLDPGVYAASLGSALQFDVQRASYTKPITLTQVIYRPGGGTTTRSLPSSLLDGFNGLRDFLRLSAADTAGKVVASTRPLFCLNEGPQRAVPDSAGTNPYPPGCASDPFPKSLVMGLPRGWAADPAGFSLSFPPPTVRLAPGTYKMTATIAPQPRPRARTSRLPRRHPGHQPRHRRTAARNRLTRSPKPAALTRRRLLPRAQLKSDFRTRRERHEALE